MGLNPYNPEAAARQVKYREKQEFREYDVVRTSEAGKQRQMQTMRHDSV